MWIIKDDIAMSCLPKNGSMTIRNIVRNTHIYMNDEVLSIPRRVAWIRNPIERLQSAYSFFYYLNEQNTQCDKSVVTESWEKFIDHALSTENAHWCKQKEALSIDGRYIATETYRFESMQEKWGEIIPGLLPWVLPWINRCTSLPIDEYRRREIENAYSEDIRFWHSL